MPAMNNQQGAGMLKGTPYLLFNDFKNLSDRPDYDLYEQTNKLRDALIRLDVLLGMAGKRDRYKDVLDGTGETSPGLWGELNDLMDSHYNFNSIEGTNDWKNDYWRKLTHLYYGIYKLQAQEKLIETETGQDLRAPFDLKGGGAYEG